MALSLDSIRHLFRRRPVSSRDSDQSPATFEMQAEELRQERVVERADTPERAIGRSLAPSNGGQRNGGRPPDLANLMSAYLNARAEEIVETLVDGLSKQATRELSDAVEDTRQSISAEIREGAVSSQRELSRIGRELIRSGATLETVQAMVSSVGAAVERLEATLRAEWELHREGALGGLDEILSTLDGLEIGLAEGRELVRAVDTAHRRLKDTTVQRWWRAMGEATGVKRPLPEVPVEDAESLIAGLELTYRRLQDVLARRGVSAIEAVGKPFDPYVHEAVATEPCPEDRDGLVLREQRRGYRTVDRVIRLSQVVVGRGEPAKGAAKARQVRSLRKPPTDQVRAEEQDNEMEEKRSIIDE